MFHCDVAFVLVFFLSLKVSSSNKLCPRGKKAVGFFFCFSSMDYSRRQQSSDHHESFTYVVKVAGCGSCMRANFLSVQAGGRNNLT